MDYISSYSYSTCRTGRMPAARYIRPSASTSSFTSRAGTPATAVAFSRPIATVTTVPRPRRPPRRPPRRHVLRQAQHIRHLLRGPPLSPWPAIPALLTLYPP